jgi:hypothetical protein
MPPTTETETKELRDLVIGLREEIRVGFANNNTKFAEIRGEIQKMEAELKGEILRVEAKTDAKFAEIKAEFKEEIQQVEVKLKGEIQRVEVKTDDKLAGIKGQVDVLDERTKISFWGFIWRALISGTLLLLVGFAARYLLLGKLEI